MTFLRHTFFEAMRNFWHRPVTTLGAVIALALLLLLFDLFWISARTVDTVYADLVTGLKMEAFVTDSLAETEIDHLNSELTTIPGISTAAYISRESAREELVRLTGVDLLADTTLSNPLPRSFVLTVRGDSINSASFTFIENSIRGLPGIDHVNYSRDWLADAESTRIQIHRFGFVIGILIAVAALLNLANNIRLISLASAVGLEQARLLGAGKFFLSSPYLLEGFLLGGTAATIGWTTLHYFQQKLSIGALHPVFPEMRDIVWFCLLAAAIGAISGFLGIRRVLK